LMPCRNQMHPNSTGKAPRIFKVAFISPGSRLRLSHYGVVICKEVSGDRIRAAVDAEDL
jgi:hypothetical protein